MSISQNNHLPKDFLPASYIPSIISNLNETKHHLTILNKTQLKLMKEIDCILKLIKSQLQSSNSHTNTISHKDLISFIDLIFNFNSKLSNINNKTLSFLSQSSHIKQLISHNQNLNIFNSNQTYSQNVNTSKQTIPSIKHYRNGNGGSCYLNTSPTDYSTSILNTFKKIPTGKVDLMKQGIIISNMSKQKSKLKYNNIINTTNDIINRVKTFTKGNKKICIKRNNYNNSNINISNFNTFQNHSRGNSISSIKTHSISPLKSTFKPKQTTFLNNNNKPIKNLIILHNNYNDKYMNAKTKMLNAGISENDIFHKEFNIFVLQSIIGHEHILPIIGKAILNEFNLINNSLITISKLDSFFYIVSNTYLKTTLYHNSIHGSDVTQTIALYFLNSNAKEICNFDNIDLLSIFIAALGHDIAHPGLTNAFQINSQSEMAITYNDISCLENFHISTLYKILNQNEYNIFSNLQMKEYTFIRKRIVNMILATDMANHGKVMNNIESKILFNNNKLQIISGNDKMKFNEQQAVLDYFIHSADLAHNTKLFTISLQWVELLSNEFWLQGDKEKEMKLPINFLCDRNDTDVPKSQVGFIKGFILPTFDVLIKMFPTLDYTVNNAKINIDEWQKRVDKGDKRGWMDTNNNSDNNVKGNVQIIEMLT